MAIELRPQHAAIYSNRGICHATLGDYQRAVDDYDAAIRLDPRYPIALYKRSIVLNGMQRYQEALDDLLKAARLRPENSEILNQIAWTYLKIRAAASAIEFANRAIALNSQFGNAYDTRAAGYEALGDRER